MSEITDQTAVVRPPAPLLPPPVEPAPPKPRARIPELSPRNLGWLVLAALLGDIALRTGVHTLSSTVVVAIVAGPILASVHRAGAWSRLYLVLAMVFAVWLPVRASAGLTLLNFGAVSACLVAAVVAQRSAEWRWNTATAGVVLARTSLGSLFGGVFTGSIHPLRKSQLERIGPAVRGIVIAAIPVTILGALLASADTVFAQSFDFDFDLGFNATRAFEHLLLMALVGAAIAGLVAMTGVPRNETFDERRPLGVVETTILLGAIATLYGAFCVVQLVSALGGADAVLQEQRLTYAEYARSGFFQLLWVAALTAVLLGAVRLLTAEASPQFDRLVRLLGAVVALFTLVIVCVAIVRLRLYTDEFGQTTLRWYCTAFAWMLGAAFVAIATAHVPRFERTLPAILIGLAVGTLFAVNLANPEARVAEHNLTRSDAAERLDADYLVRLSADAWPVLLRYEPLVNSRLAANTRPLSDRCERVIRPNGYGIAGFNLAEQLLDCG